MFERQLYSCGFTLVCELAGYPMSACLPIARWFMHNIVCTANWDIELFYKLTHSNVTISLNQSWGTPSIVSPVDVLGHLALFSSLKSVLPLSNSIHQNHACFHDVTHLPYTSTNCWSISAEEFFFKYKNSPCFCQHSHLLTEILSCYGTTSSIYRHLSKYCDRFHYLKMDFYSYG